MMQRMLKMMRNDRGSSVVILAVGIVAFLGFMAIVADMGRLYWEKSRMTIIVDAAAIAGIQEMLPPPGSQSAAQTVAESYATLNGARTGEVVATPASDRLTVTGTRQVPLFFTGLFGKSTSSVAVTTVAIIGPTSSATGLVPFAIAYDTLKDSSGNPQTALTYNTAYLLKVGSGNWQKGEPAGYHGNFGSMGLGGTGGDTYRDNIANGYNGPALKVNDWIATEPGNMVGPTKTGVDQRMARDTTTTWNDVAAALAYRDANPGAPLQSALLSPLIITVPIVNSLLVSGRTDVQIVGFATMFLEGTANLNGDTVVNARFIEFSKPGTVGGGGSFGTWSYVLREQ